MSECPLAPATSDDDEEDDEGLFPLAEAEEVEVRAPRLFSRVFGAEVPGLFASTFRDVTDSGRSTAS